MAVAFTFLDISVAWRRKNSEVDKGLFESGHAISKLRR
jgi:hypothetical protein